MRLIFVDRDKEICDVLRWRFRSHPEVEVACGRFEDLPAFDCVVTAGNSFGLMDAGMDSLEASLQLCLAYEHFLKPPTFINPSMAQQRQERVYYGGRWGFTQPRKSVT